MAGRALAFLANVRNGNPGISAAVITLSGDNLVVMVAVDVQPGSAPRIEVAAGLHGAARALVDADGPVLVKGADTVNARLFVTGALAKSIGAAVAGHCAQIAGSGRRVVGPEILDDIVLNERVAGPAVDGKVAVTVGLVCARVLDRSMQ